MEEIRSQIIFLLGSFLSGVAVMLAYEAVNVLRGLFRPGIVWKFLMDLIFFLLSGICVFRMIFLCNHGTIRSFFVFAFAAGAILYYKTVGNVLSDLIVRVIRKLWHLVTWPFVRICRGIRRMAGKLRERKRRFSGKINEKG